MQSLERQLQKNLAIVLILILIGLLLVAKLSTRSLLEDFVTARLEHDAERLLVNLVLVEEIPKIKWQQINPLYNDPYSGHYYAIKLNPDQENEIILLSRSLQEESIPTPLSKKPMTQHDIKGPETQRLILWSKTYQKNGRNLVVSIAEDMSLLMQKRRYFTLFFISIGVIGFLLILGSQRYVIRRLFRSLDASRSEVKQIELGGRKQLSEKVPSEIYPLVKEFNHSLSMMQQRMERSRNSLGNLAHALKTPISLLMQQLDSGEIDIAKAKQQADRIRKLMDRELKRARMAGLGNTSQRFDPREELPTLFEVLKQAHQKNHLKLTLDVSDSITVFGDREDMLELLGNLMDNAYKWSQSEIICTLSERETKIEENKIIQMIVEDDGDGKNIQQLEQIAQRGIRLDESIEGHGLGLAICKDIVKLYGGSIYFSHSETLGGFKVEVNLPLNTEFVMNT